MSINVYSWVPAAKMLLTKSKNTQGSASTKNHLTAI